MGPPLINDSTFSSYSLSEIWPITTTHLPPLPTATDHSTLTHHSHSHNPRKRKDAPSDDVVSTSAPHQLEEQSDSGNKHVKLVEETSASKVEAEASSAKPSSDPPKQDYIHVRARRGQATDSHSLAERARREKISERMKILQDLVPGCNKVIGKALVLDEIINYIQSLQRQVEFLSMKLEAVNSRLNMNPTTECFPSKDVGTQPFDLAGMIFGSQGARGYAQGSQPGWLQMQLGGGFERAT